MKNLLILIVAAALFLHFYPQPELEAWYAEQKAMVLGKFSDATDTKVRLSSQKVYRDIEASFDQFNSDEIKFVKEITESRESVKTFFASYCDTEKQTPKLHKKNQKLVCDKISPYQSLF